MVPKKPTPDHESTLPFDVTQEIDAALAEDLRERQPTVEADPYAATVVLPEKRKP